MLKSNNNKSPSCSGFRPTWEITLTDAAKFGDIELLKNRLAISKGSDLEESYATSIDKCDHVSGGPLTKAAERGNLEVVSYLLKSGADPKGGTEPYGPNNQALLKASENGHIEVVKTLLAHGADLHLEGFDKPDLELYNAALHEKKDMVYFLLGNENYSPDSSLLAASMIDDPSLVEDLLEKREFLPKEIEAAVSGALECGSPNVLELVIEEKVPLKKHQQALVASALGNIETLNKLLPKASKDFDSNYYEESDLTLASQLLKTAARFNQPKIVKWVLEALDQNQTRDLIENQGEGGLSSLFAQACKYSSLEVLDLFKGAGARIDFQSDFGVELPIFNAAKAGQTNVCKYLLSLGANKATAYTVPQVQKNPLDLVYIAAQAGHTNTANNLVKLGCSLPKAIVTAAKELNPKVWKTLTSMSKSFPKSHLHDNIALICAVEQKDKQTTQWILKSGINPKDALSKLSNPEDKAFLKQEVSFFQDNHLKIPSDYLEP
jgi:ankyrin repeat protein